MRDTNLHWWRHSIFFRILLIILLSYIAMIYASIATHRTIFRSHRFGKNMENSINFCRYIAGDIGIPPDTVRAAAIAEKLNISIRILSEGLNWSSPEDMKAIDRLKLTECDEEGVYAGFDHGFEVELESDGTCYQFLLQSRKESIPYAVELGISLHLLYITVLLALIYLALRWQLKPLGLLHHSVLRVASGDLDFEIDSPRRDELGMLVRSFNAMRVEILEMLLAREQLLLDVSHEFRSPLTRMKVSLEMMEGSDERDNLISDIAELETMITELLESARIQSPHGGLEMRHTDITALLEESCLEFEGSRPGVNQAGKSKPVFLEIDEARMRIVFKNIIANAVKYSPADGKPVEVSIDDSDATVTVVVKDHGSGIPQKELPFIFEPFYRVDKSRSKGTGGYGLGMHLSKKIVEAHGGDISIDSRLGEGTTVTIRIGKKPTSRG